MITRAGIFSRFKLAAFALALVAVVASSGDGAHATLTSNKTVSQSISSGFLQPVPAAPVAARGTCIAKVSHQVRLTWQQTPSLFADGYDILRKTGAASYASVGTVAGPTTTTFTDQFGDSGWDTTYVYVVQAKRNLWRSADSPAVSITTEKRANCN